MKKILIWLFGLGLLFMVSACTIEDKTTTTRTIKIWVIAPLSGPAADYGTDWVNIYTYLINKFNSVHHDIQIQLIIEDSKCDGKDAVSAVQKLINIDRVPVILWWSCSSETIPAATIAQANKTVLVDSVSSAPAISNIGDYIFKFINDIYAGKKLSDKASRTFRSIALVYDNNDYGSALADVIRKNYTWRILADIKVQIDEKDLSIVAKQIKQSGAQGLVVIDQDDTHAIAKIKAFEKEWLLETYSGKLMSSYFYSANTFLNAVGDLVEGAMQVDVPLVDSLWLRAKNFVNEFQLVHPIMVVPSYIVFQWEAMNIVLDAISSWNYNSDAIKQYLQASNKISPRDGLFGEYYFEGSDAVWIPYVIQKIENRKPIIIE